jgi:hypothetical protein
VDPSGLDWTEKFSSVWDAGLIDSYNAGTVLADKAKKSAGDFARDLYGGNKKLMQQSLNAGKADGYRHCVWSCLMTYDFGAEDAKEIGDNHEAAGKRNGQSDADINMDLHNNKIGRVCGVNKRPETCETKCKKKLSKFKILNKY